MCHLSWSYPECLILLSYFFRAVLCSSEKAAKKKAAIVQAKRDSRQALLSARQRENAQNNSAPTEREIEEGVQHAVGEAVEHGGGDSKEGRGAKSLNAFDLVNQCGGFALERVFRPRADKVTKREFQFSSYHHIDQVMTGLTGTSLPVCCYCCCCYC